MERLGELAVNPVQQHIHMHFRTVDNEAKQVQAVLDDLTEKRFDPTLSRVLVFVRTQKQAEQMALAISQQAERRGLSWATNVDYFHAGLDALDRNAKYKAYKTPVSGRSEQEKAPDEEEEVATLVLVATKAFGMGMDIPNIHYLYHLGPSGTFEDFLQEVGRAGRNVAQRERAGFIKGQPIESLCVLTRADFGLLRDLLHKSDLSWQYVLNTQQLLHRHLARMGRLELPMKEPFALPLDLSQSGLANADDDAVRFRLSLHWLEELGRLHLGMYTLTHLPLTLTMAPNYDLLQHKPKQWGRQSVRLPVQADERQRVQQFVADLQASPFREGDALSVNLPLDELLRLTGEKQYSAAFRLLFKAQRARALLIDRSLWLRSTKTRQAEMQAWQDSHWKAGGLPLVEALFDMANRLLQLLPVGGGQRRIEPSEWNHLVQEVAAEYFTPNHVYWAEIGARKQPLGTPATCRRLSQDWQQRRARFALNLIRFLPGVQTKTLFDVKGPERGARIQVIGAEAGVAQRHQVTLGALRRHLVALLQYVAQAGQTRFNYATVVLELELEDEDKAYLDNLLFLARSLGYLNSNGSLLPTGIELFMDDLSVPDSENHTAEAKRAASDAQVYQQFEEGRQLKQLRLLALECLSGLGRDKQDAFIRAYFSCEGSAALVGLLGDYLGPQHPKLQAYRGEALKDEEARLNEQQRRVYEAPLDQHLQVIAGPGSGKTHTLTLRVARLIHQENVKPEEIVVLAYNRAVVLELKERLGRLFQRLGYGRLINRLHVYTFHGFCQRLLGEQLQGKDYDEWVPSLRQALKANPALLQVELRQSISYVFVDEFQDITTERLQILHLLAPPEQTRVCVIGDPNQSIYGYERARARQPIAPYPYYQEFAHLYPHGQPYYLTDNYRSYPAILVTAAGLLADSPSGFKELPALRARREVPATAGQYCEVIDARLGQARRWPHKLQELLAETYQPMPDSQGRPRPPRAYQQVAVMLRSNDEVFRAYTELSKLSLPDGVILRVQGTSGSPVTSREFRELLLPLYAAPDAPLPPSFLDDFRQRKEAWLTRQGHGWDPYLMQLLHCLLLEFLLELEHRGQLPVDTTCQELLIFLTDLARHDDGHFARLYAKHIRTVAPHEPERREVVLTTMHKVKGLEFDAVLLPPSFSDFAQKVDEDQLPEVVAEERRLLYVAYTRARYRLAVFNHERELAVAQGRAFTLGEEYRQRLGRLLPDPGKDEDHKPLGRVYIGWWAKELTQSIYQLICEKVAIGDPVTLCRLPDTGKFVTDKWAVKWRGNTIGMLAGPYGAKMPKAAALTGLHISEISCFTYEQVLAGGISRFIDDWGTTARTRGYVYVVDIAGYYQEQ